MRRSLTIAFFMLLGAASVTADASSLAVGGLLQPFTSNVLTGTYRGQQHCFVCDLPGGAPTVLVFSRRADEPTARLLRSLNLAVHSRRGAGLFCWFVLLGPAGSEHETALEARGEAFGRANPAPHVPLSVLGQPEGPPGYDLPPDADVVVFLARGRKIVEVRTFRGTGWNDRTAECLAGEVRGLGPPSKKR